MRAPPTTASPTFQRVDAFADLGHHAGHLQAGDEGQRRLVLVFAAGLQQVGEVHRRGAHLDQHLARPGLGGRDLLQHAAGVVGRQFLDHQGPHQPRLSAFASSRAPGRRSRGRRRRRPARRR